MLEDAETDPRVLPEQRGIYPQSGITAVICVPLHKAAGSSPRWRCTSGPPGVDGAEIDLLTTVVGRCWESLQRAHALARGARERGQFRLLVERASDAIWLADGDGRYIEVNRRPARCSATPGRSS